MLSKNSLIITILIFFFYSNNLYSKYLDSKSCNECHPNIYQEHSLSMHSKSAIFVDEIHTKMKEKISPTKYECALCHTPAVNDLRDLIKGNIQPNEHDEQLKDGVSCFYCHQISKVIFTKHKGINFYSYKENEKPTFFANLVNSENSDKHNSSSENEIYSNNQVCMGCHSHKINKNDIQICNTLDEIGKTSDCISCHMPKQEGAPTKLNAKARKEHTSHEFLGIHSSEMVKQAVELKLKQLDKTHFELNIKNKMGHSIITQPMRLKFAKTEILRDKKAIWSNFQKDIFEDKEATFSIIFRDLDSKPTFPSLAQGYLYNVNLKAKEEKKIIYEFKDLQKGDIIKSTWISYIISPKIAQKLDIKDEELKKPIFGQSIQIIVE